MKIVDTQGKLIYELPDKPRKRDVSSNFGTRIRYRNENVAGNPNCSPAFKAGGWAHGKAYGLEVDGERLKIGSAKDFDQACYRLTQLRRAYLDGAETFTAED